MYYGPNLLELNQNFNAVCPNKGCRKFGKVNFIFQKKINKLLTAKVKKF